MASITITQLRTYVKDFASINKIFVEREFTDTELQNAITWGLAMADAVPPFIDSFDNTSLPQYIQLKGALALLFESVGLYNMRNQSQLTEQGLPVPIGENANIYLQMADKFKQEFTEMCRVFKLSVNLNNMYTYQKSPYYNSPTSGNINDDGGSYY